MRKNYALVRERFAATLYAKMGGGKPRWTPRESIVLCGARSCLCFETRGDDNVARAPFAPQVDGAERGDARTTTFIWYWRRAVGDVVTEADKEKIANDRDALANTKGKLFGD